MSSRRNKKGGGHGGGGGEEAWLLPYADMITLLLGLFIVMFAMSSVDAKKFDNVKRSLSQTFRGDVLEESGGVLDGADGVLDPEAANQRSEEAVVLQQYEQASDAAAGQLAKQQEELAKLVEQQANIGNDTKVSRNERGIKVSLAGDALFAPGSSELRPEVREQLTVLERKLASFGRPIEIAGHTDGVPFNGEYGNWALSADRAEAVVVFFLEKGYPGSIKASFHADTQPAVKAPKGREHASVPANRRIEITVLAPGADVAGGPSQGAIESALRHTEAREAAGDGHGDADVSAAVEHEVSRGIVEELAAASKGMH